MTPSHSTPPPATQPRILAYGLTLVIALAAATSLAACSNEDNRSAGQQLDSAIAKTEQSAAQAKADVQQGAAALEADAKAAAAKAGQAVDNAADKAAAAVDKTANQVGEAFSDAGITASVNAELAKDEALSALRINVDTKNGQVVLRGTAPNSNARDRASALANAVKGVVGVDNQLELRG